MERFKGIYPFTTENIAGYMEKLNLSDKKIITVTGSGDHVINALVQGTRDITTFDVNPISEYYLDLKLSAIKSLEYKDFLKFLLYIGDRSLDYDIFKKLELNDKSYEFFEKKYYEVGYDGEALRRSPLFINKYFNVESKIEENLYLDLKNYNYVKGLIDCCDIRFINSNLVDLKLMEKYDYMFLSNIADYLNLMFDGDYLENYYSLLGRFDVDNIYFAYLYDFYKKSYRSVIDNLGEVEKVFGEISWEVIPTALEGVCRDVKDAVLILKRR